MNRCGTLKTVTAGPKVTPLNGLIDYRVLGSLICSASIRLWIWDCDRIYQYILMGEDQITNVFSKYTLCWGSTVRYRRMAYVRTELPFISARKDSRWSWECWVTQSLLLPQKDTDGQTHAFTLTRLYCNQACCLLAYAMQVTEDHWHSSVNSRLEWCV